MANTQQLSGFEKATQQLISTIKQSYGNEFAVAMHDGVLLAMHKDCFKDMTVADSLLYEAVKFGNDVGSVQTKFISPSAAILPQYPLRLELQRDYVNHVNGNKFFDKAHILSGAHHLDHVEKLLPSCHQYDEQIISLATVAKSNLDPNYRRFAKTAVLDAIDISSATNDEPKQFADEIFQNFFPHLDQTRCDYVLLAVFSLSSGLAYVMDSNKDSVYVGDKTFSIDVENDRLNSEANVYCRLLFSTENTLAFNRDVVESMYGNIDRKTNKQTNARAFNESLENGLMGVSEKALQLKSNKLLQSTVTAHIMNTYQMPVDHLKSDGSIAKRLREIRHTYLHNLNKKLADVPQSDSIAAMAMQSIIDMGISPSSFMSYRKEPSWRPESALPEKEVKGKTSNPFNMWAPTFEQLVEINSEREISNRKLDKEAVTPEMEIDVRLRQTMKMAEHNVFTLFNIRDHICYSYTFRNTKELYDETQRCGEMAVSNMSEPDLTKLKNMKLKPITAFGYFNCKFNMGQECLAMFHYDPMSFKRIYIYNMLYILLHKTGVCGISSKNEEITNPHFPLDSKQTTCVNCGNVPFYCGETKMHCLCMLILECYGLFANLPANTDSDVRVVHQLLMGNLKDNRGFSGEMTSYKTLITAQANESRTSNTNTHFGNISIKHCGRPDGFGIPSQAARSNRKQQDGTSNSDISNADQTNLSNREFSAIAASNLGSTSGGMDTKLIDGLRQTRKLSKLVEDVLNSLCANANITDPKLTLPVEHDKRDQSFKAFSRMWLKKTDREFTETDVRFLANGLVSDAKLRANLILTTITESNKQTHQLLASEVLPQMTHSPKQTKLINPEHISLVVGQKRHCENDNEWGDKCDESKAESPPKQIKSDSERNADIILEEFVTSVLLQIINEKESKLHFTDRDINPRFHTLLSAWRKNPKQYTKKFAIIATQLLFGKDYVKDKNKGVTDPSSILYRFVESFLEHIPVLIKRVHTTVASLLPLSPADLDVEFSQFVHYNDRIKRGMDISIDLSGGATDTLHAKASSLLTYATIRHELDVTGVKKSITVTKQAATDIIHANKGGINAKCISGSAAVYVPVVVMNDNKNNANDQFPKLAVKPLCADEEVSFMLVAPLKLKVNVNATSFDFDLKSTQKQPLGDDCGRSRATTANESYRFTPSSILYGPNAGPDESTCKPLSQLIDILRDPALKFSNIGTHQFASISEQEKIAAHIFDYLTTRRSKSNGSHVIFPYALTALTNAINSNTYQIVGMFMKKLVSCVTQIVGTEYVKRSNALIEMQNCFEKFQSTSVNSKTIPTIIRSICIDRPELGSALYVYILSSELYSPVGEMKNTNRYFEQSRYVVYALVCAVLRLHIRRSQCGDSVASDDNTQTCLTKNAWGYWSNSKKLRPTMTTCDINRGPHSIVMFHGALSSYQMEKISSDVFTTLRGATQLTKMLTPAAVNVFVPLGGSDTAHNMTICQPLYEAPSTQTVLRKEVLSIREILQTFTLGEFIDYFDNNVNMTVFESLVAIYKQFVRAERPTDEDIMRACMMAHSNDYESPSFEMDIFRDKILPHVDNYIYGKPVTLHTANINNSFDDDMTDDDECDEWVDDGFKAF